MLPRKFADSMRTIVAEGDTDIFFKRALAHCIDALEGIGGYEDGLQILYERLGRTDRMH